MTNIANSVLERIQAAMEAKVKSAQGWAGRLWSAVMTLGGITAIIVLVVNLMAFGIVVGALSGNEAIGELIDVIPILIVLAILYSLSDRISKSSINDALTGLVGIVFVLTALAVAMTITEPYIGDNVDNTLNAVQKAYDDIMSDEVEEATYINFTVEEVTWDKIVGLACQDEWLKFCHPLRLSDLDRPFNDLGYEPVYAFASPGYAVVGINPETSEEVWRVEDGERNLSDDPPSSYVVLKTH